jgi:hypothetical protein
MAPYSTRPMAVVSWEAQTSGTTATLWSVHFVDANTGWAVGQGGTILIYQAEQEEAMTEEWCVDNIITGHLTEGMEADSVSIEVFYTGGNGGSYDGQSVASEGVTGLTATLLPGNLENGDGSVIYQISGTPNDMGDACFSLSMADQTCTLCITVQPGMSCEDGLGDSVIEIPSLPYESTDRTTCGAGDNLNSANTISCGDPVGEEEVFIFSPGETAVHHIAVTASVSNSRISLFRGCPLLGQGGECIGTVSSGSSMSLFPLLVFGETYYLIVSRATSSGCFNYDISISRALDCPDDLGDAVINIPSLPYVSTGRTTCGAGNNLNSANTISCSNPAGEEEVFIFTPDITQLYHIEMNSNSSSARMILYKGCPLFGQGGECIANGSGSNTLLAETLEAGETYYLIVTRIASGCHNYDISIDVPLVCPSDLGDSVIEIPSLPYVSTGRTTCGAGNNLNNANTISCSNPAGEEEVFIFTPDITQLYHIEMNSNNVNARMILYKGCPLFGQGGECIANGSGSNTLLAETLEAGETYYLIVTRIASGCHNYDISIDVPLVCPSDLGDSVIEIPSLPYVSTGRTTCGAGNNLNNANTISCSNPAGEEEVFIFTPDITQLYHIEMNSNNVNARMILYKGCPLFGQGGECETWRTGGNTLIARTLEAGETYYLIVTRSASGCHNYDISIDVPLVCPSDLGDSVIEIPSLPYVSTGRTTCGAGNNLNNANTISCSNPAGEEEVFIFTPDITQLYHIEMNSNSSSARMILYKGCPLFGQGGECETSACCSSNLLIARTLEAGETYYLIVTRTGSGCHNYDISIDIPLVCPSDLGDSVIEIPSLPYVSTGRTTCGAGNNLNNANTISCSNPAGEEEVFIFTPDITQLYHIEMNSNSSSARMILYKGCPLFGQGGECETSACCSSNLLIARTLEAGETYYLIVTRTGSGCHNYDISIDIPLVCPSDLGDSVIEIPSLPYVSTGRTTCGAGNNLNNANTISCSNPAGEEEVFIFTPDITQLYHIEMNSNSSSARMILYKGCPLFGQGGECETSACCSSNLLIARTLEAGETYYLIVTRTGSGCHNYDISIDIPLVCPSDLGDSVIEIPSLPYVSTGRTTCGAGNNLNNANTISCSNPAGEEEVFIFTPDITQLYHIEMNSNSSSARMILYKGCPLFGQGGECETSACCSSNLLIARTLEAGETYYLIVTRTGSGCHNYDISIDIPLVCPSDLGDSVIEIPSLPYVSTGRTTCGAGNNLNNANTVSCADLTGQEEVFIFTPDQRARRSFYFYTRPNDIIPHRGKCKHSIFKNYTICRLSLTG